MRLTERERETLSAVATTLVSPDNLLAVCAYGSKVAGYSRPDSDYDLIIVARKYNEGVRYRYVESPAAASALIIDELLLARDARSSYLGEFVAGRFLNVYESIVNDPLFRGVEVEYKRRVVVEALLELSSDYGDFCRHFVIPYEYFLFDKLRKRALVYPPALYSYVKTYSTALASENRRASTDGFREAAKGLVERGILEASQDGVKMLPEKLKGDAFTKVLSLFSLTTRGVTQYAVHGYAGRVGFRVFRKEAQSKLQRVRTRPDLLMELVKPRTLLRLEEGAVLPDASNLDRELARLAEMKEYTVREHDIGEAYATTRVLTFTSDGRDTSFVVKNFSDVRSLKWAILGVWAVAARKFNMAPLARLEREYDMSRRLRRSDVRTPAIIAVAPAERIMVKQFVDGPTLSHVIDRILAGGTEGLGAVAAYGELLARVHRGGVALGDAKASNVVVASDGLYLTDLEQALADGDKAWDVAEFLYYTGKLSLKEDRMKTVVETFLDAYLSRGEKDVLGRARNRKYLAPFQAFISPGMTKMIRDALADRS